MKNRVLKFDSSDNVLIALTVAEHMSDIIDIDTGGIISGEKTIEQMGEAILDYVIRAANGEVRTKAELKGQEDFIPWKRGLSL